MKIIKPALILSALLFLAIGQAAAQSFAFTNVTVIDVEEGVAKPGMTVVVTGNRISAVGLVEEINIPDGATTIDGTGKYLIPGLWDMHVHNHDPSGLTRSVILPLYVAHGVTGVREMSGSPGQLRLRAEVAEGELLGPRMVVGSPICVNIKQ